MNTQECHRDVLSLPVIYYSFPPICERVPVCRPFLSALASVCRPEVSSTTIGDGYETTLPVRVGRHTLVGLSIRGTEGPPGQSGHSTVVDISSRRPSRPLHPTTRPPVGLREHCKRRPGSTLPPVSRQQKGGDPDTTELEGKSSKMTRGPSRIPDTTHTPASTLCRCRHGSTSSVRPLPLLIPGPTTHGPPGTLVTTPETLRPTSAPPQDLVDCRVDSGRSPHSHVPSRGHVTT